MSAFNYLVRKGIRIILYLFIILTSFLTALAAFLSHSSVEGFLDTLFYAWFFGGIIILFVAFLGGSGLSESRYVSSSLMSASSIYSRTVMKEWSQRMWEQFDFLIIGAVLGFALMGLGILVVFQPLAVIPCIVALVVVMYFISKLTR